VKRISLCALMVASCFVSAGDKPSKLGLKSPVTVVGSFSQLVSAGDDGDENFLQPTNRSLRRLVQQPDGTVLEELNFSRADQESAAKQKQNLIELEAQLADLVADQEKDKRVRFFAARSWTKAAVADAIIAPAVKSNLQACLNLMQGLRKTATGQHVPGLLLDVMENLKPNVPMTIRSSVLPDIESATLGKFFLNVLRTLGTATLTLAGATFYFSMVQDGKQVSFSAFRDFGGIAGKTAMRILRTD
jgi:hypothetical protein